MPIQVIYVSSASSPVKPGTPDAEDIIAVEDKVLADFDQLSAAF